MADSRMSAVPDLRAAARMPSPPPAAQAQPFVKWAGGKRALVPVILRHLPEGMGGGIMSLS